MKSQWMLILGLLFALVVAIFAVINVDAVEVNYLFGSTRTPLILVILISTLLGGLAVGLIGMLRVFVLQRKIKQLEKQVQQLETEQTDVEAQLVVEQDNLNESEVQLEESKSKQDENK